MVSRRVTAAAVLSLLFGPLAWAQDPVVAHVGSIVRITAPSVSPKRLVGTLDGANESFLRLSTPTGPQVISRNAIERLEWSRGLHKPVLKRTLEGAVLGLAASAFAQPQHDWVNIPLARNMRARLEPRASGAAAALVVSW